VNQSKLESGAEIFLNYLSGFIVAYVVVKGMAFAVGTKDNYEAGCEYFYDEHTCPVNWMGVECLYDNRNNDTDPHGMFEYVGHEEYPEGGSDCNYDWEPLIKRIKGGRVQ